MDEVPAQPESSNSRTRIPMTGSVAETLASTKDPNQNVLTPAERKWRREPHAAAATSRQENNMSRDGDEVFREMLVEVEATHRSEIDIFVKNRTSDADETEEAIRETAVPELARVGREGIEVTLADPEPSAAADASSPFRERFRAVLEGINQQLPSERSYQITFEVSMSDQDAEEKPRHLLQAMRRLVRFCQGVKEIK